MGMGVVLPPMSYEEVWAGAGQVGELSLSFVSATGFRKAGNHMPLPIPENLFHSYLRRWNRFAMLEFEQEDFLKWVGECVVILRHEIRSLKVQAGKMGSVTGFVGSVQLGLVGAAQKEPEYVQLVRALVSCAPYFGTGHKGTFGLGQTRIGYGGVENGELRIEKREVRVVNRELRGSERELVEVNSALAEKVNAEVEVNAGVGVNVGVEADVGADVVRARKGLIQARVVELEAMFFAAKKRQGGDRARTAARTWAVIMARYELGDSLKAIAADLDMNYETVRRYVKLARKMEKEMGERMRDEL